MSEVASFPATRLLFQSTAAPARTRAIHFMARLPSENTSSSRQDGAAPLDTPVVDVELLTDYLGFLARSVRRHWQGTALTVAATLVAVVIGVSVWPRTYQIDGRLLVQSSSLVSSLVNPERGATREGLGPTLAAQEIVKSRDKLLAIMEETQLLAEWERTRTPIFKAKDWLMALVFGQPTPEGRVDAMAGLLEDRLQVGTNDEGTVTFILRWPDPDMGRKLVDGAMQSFLEHRRVTEAAAITDSIAILERSANAIESDIKGTLELLPAPAGSPRRRAAARPTVSGPSAEVTVRLARLRSALAERQQEVSRLEAAHTQQRGEAQARLSAALTIYTEGHPTVVSLKQTVARLSAEPPELAAARRDARSLETEYDELSTRVGALTATAEQEQLMSQLEAATPAASMELLRPSTGDADPVGLRLKNQMAELAMVQARASAARAEYASAEAGFKYQYSVVRPPQLPRAPVAPNVPAILFAGLVASVLLGLVFALGSDLASGRALEA